MTALVGKNRFEAINVELWGAMSGARALFLDSSLCGDTNHVGLRTPTSDPLKCITNFNCIYQKSLNLLVSIHYPSHHLLHQYLLLALSWTMSFAHQSVTCTLICLVFHFPSTVRFRRGANFSGTCFSKIQQEFKKKKRQTDQTKNTGFQISAELPGLSPL